MASEEKTEKATPKRREDARKKGQVVKSNDLNSAFILLSLFGVLKVVGPFCVDSIKKIFVFYLSTFNKYAEPLTVSVTSTVMLDIMIAIVVILIPIFLTAILVSSLANALQTGFLYTTEPLKMNLGKLNPIAGFKRIFSFRAIAAKNPAAPPPITIHFFIKTPASLYSPKLVKCNLLFFLS